MSNKPLHACNSCKFVHRENGMLQCRRYPPSATPVLVPTPPTPGNPNGSIGIQGITLWPQVQAENWCGEHDPVLKLH